MHRNLFTKAIVVIVLMIFGTMGFVSGQEIAPHKKSILLLNSYNKGYVWSDDIISAVEKRIEGSGTNANIDIEYMNSKQIYDKQYFDKLYELYKYKYSKRKYDIIIASDDDAFKFMTRFRDELFPDVPVVFCGVNNVGEVKHKQLQNFTGIVEDTGFDATVDMIRTLHPAVKRIHIITDDTTTGKIIIKDVIDTSTKHPSVAFTIQHTDNINEMLQGLSKLDENSVVVLTSTSVKNEDGSFLSINETAERVVGQTKVPVYALRDFFLGNGVVGSKIGNASFQGDTAAKMAIALLNGQSISKLPVVNYTNKQFVYDYNGLKKFGIKLKSLPKGSKIINKPINSYNFSGKVLLGFSILLLCLLTFINFLLLINIKRRKRAEEALQKSEGIIRATLNATAEGILVTSLDKKIIDYNPLFLKMWQFPTEVIEKKDLLSMLEYAMNLVQNPKRHLDWTQKSYKQSQPAFDTVYLKNGKVYEVYSEALTIQGELHGRAWSFKDITARKKVEMELQRSEERYRRLVELSPDAIYMAVDGKNVYTNKAGLGLLGAVSEADIYGKSIMDFVYDNYSENIKGNLTEYTEPNNILPLAEMRLKRFDNTTVEVEAATTTFDYNGEKAVLSVVRDITERKETESLKRSVEEKTRQLSEAWEYDKLKTEFFANISHELRTPINVILGAQKLFGLLLEGLELGDKQQKLIKYIYMMRQNCYRLMRLVNNLIDITRIDAGFFNINLKNYDIVNIVECITLSVVEYVQEKGIELIFDTQLEEKIIACDADKIERIMLNLLSNAIKFTNKGGSITVCVSEEAENIVITVSDTGIGIPEEKINIVFERFVQVDKSFVRNHEGSGIGLSLVKSLVDLHGGSIELRSEINKGTIFEIRLPVILVAEEEAAVTSDVTYQSSAERINVEFSDIYF